MSMPGRNVIASPDLSGRGNLLACVSTSFVSRREGEGRAPSLPSIPPCHCEERSDVAIL